MTLKIGARTKLGLFFPVVCFIHVFDQTLTEQLYRDRGLLRTYFHFNGGSGEGGRGRGKGDGEGVVCGGLIGGALAQLSPVMKRLQEGKVQQVKK